MFFNIGKAKKAENRTPKGNSDPKTESISSASTLSTPHSSESRGTLKYSWLMIVDTIANSILVELVRPSHESQNIHKSKTDLLISRYSIEFIDLFGKSKV